MGCSTSNTASVNSTPGVVDLYVFPRTSAALHLSPPCMKVESFLRWNKIPYIAHLTTDFSFSPTGRLPCAIIKNKLVADSEHIISELISAYNILPPASMTPKLEREGRLVRVALEYATRYHVMRWQLVDHFDWVVDSSKEYAPSVPRWILKQAISAKNRNPAIDMLNTHGQGDLSQAEFHAEFLEDVKTVEGMVAETGAFIVTADAPSRYDATVYSILNIIRVAEAIKDDAPGAQYVTNSRVLQDYLRRMDHMCFPDMAGLLTTRRLETRQVFTRGA